MEHGLFLLLLLFVLLLVLFLLVRRPEVVLVGDIRRRFLLLLARISPSLRISTSRSTARPSSVDAATSTSPSTTQSRSPAGSFSLCVTRQCSCASSSSSKRSGDLASVRHVDGLVRLPVRFHGVVELVHGPRPRAARRRRGGELAHVLLLAIRQELHPSERAVAHHDPERATRDEITRRVRSAAAAAAASDPAAARAAASGSLSASHSSIRLESTWRIVSPNHSSRSHTALDLRFSGTFCTRDLYAVGEVAKHGSFAAIEAVVGDVLVEVKPELVHLARDRFGLDRLVRTRTGARGGNARSASRAPRRGAWGNPSRPVG